MYVAPEKPAVFEDRNSYIIISEKSEENKLTNAKMNVQHRTTVRRTTVSTIHAYLYIVTSTNNGK